MLVTTLNWLALRRPRLAPEGALGRSPLRPCHLAILVNLDRLAEEWACADHVQLSDLGRTAVKLGSVQRLYDKLHAQARGLLAATGDLSEVCQVWLRGLAGAGRAWPSLGLAAA